MGGKSFTPLTPLDPVTEPLMPYVTTSYGHKQIVGMHQARVVPVTAGNQGREIARFDAPGPSGIDLIRRLCPLAESPQYR